MGKSDNFHVGSARGAFRRACYPRYVPPRPAAHDGPAAYDEPVRFAVPELAWTFISLSPCSRAPQGSPRHASERMGGQGAFDKAMVKKSGAGFGASTSKRFDQAKGTSAGPSAASYNPELARASVKRAGAGFGASKSGRFGGPRESCQSAPSPAAYQPDHSQAKLPTKSKRRASGESEPARADCSVLTARRTPVHVHVNANPYTCM